MRQLLAITVFTMTALFTVNCGKSDDDAASGTTTTFGGPGSAWTATPNGDGTFTFTKADTLGGSATLTVTASSTTVTSGFLKLTVTAASSTNAPTVGSTAYAMYIPGFVMLVKPIDSSGEDKIIPMVVTGTCPTSTTNFNWMVTSHSNSGSENMTDDEDLLGTASWNGTDTMSLPSKFNIGGTALTAGDNISGSCSSGTINLTEADIWLSASQSAIVKTANGQTIVAMPQETISAQSDFDGDYYGLLFDDSQTEKVSPVWANLGTTNNGGSYTDIDNDTKDTAGVTFNNFNTNNPGNGFMSFDLTSGANTSGMVCQTASGLGSNNQKMMFCVGTTPGDNTRLFNVLLISK